MKKKEVHENGFEFDEKVTKDNRDRYLLNGEIVALSCKACEEAFGLDGFSKNKYGTYGKYNQCKECHTKRASRWNEANPEKRRVTNSRWNNKNRAQVHALATTTGGL